MPRAQLRFLHAHYTLNGVKLAHLRRLHTDELKNSLSPGQAGALKARPDGTMLDGHHRVAVLIERGEDVQLLPREIIEKESDAS